MDEQKAKRIIPKVIFILSFLPIVLILVHGVYSAIVGYEPLLAFSYPEIIRFSGWKAFEYVFTSDLLIWSIIPVLPIMAIYQISLIIVSILGKTRKEPEENAKIRRAAFKVVFVLSFLPELIFLICLIYHAVAGYDVYMGDVIYGFEAVKHILTDFEAYRYIMLWFPPCIIYQLVFIIVSIVKKVKNKKTN